MNDSENRRHEMFTRVRDFGVAHTADFAAASIGKQLFTNITTIVTELDSHSSSQASGFGSARQGTATRAQARGALRDDLEAINRTARAMAGEHPGIDDNFRLPRGTNDQNLIAAARAFAADAAPLSAEFIAHELPADFLTDLRDDIAAMDQAISAQSSGVGGHVAAGAAIEDAIDRGVDTVRKLDAIVKNKYSNNPAALAEWTSASHTERAPRHHKSSNPQPSQPPGPGGTPAPGGAPPAP
jgi:hypothetical protein